MADPDAKPPALEGEVVTRSTSVGVTKHDENIVVLLETAFNNGFNITEACQYAGVSRKTFYEWLGDDDLFSYRMSVAQSALHRKAKSNITQAIQAGDPGISLRYLQLRDPDFKPKATIETPEGHQRTEEKLKEFMDDTDDGAYPDAGNAVSGEPVTPDQPESGDEVAPGPSDIS